MSLVFFLLLLQWKFQFASSPAVGDDIISHFRHSLVSVVGKPKPAYSRMKYEPLWSQVCYVILLK